MNTFGNIFRLTSYGESHGRAIGGILDGVPAGIIISLSQVQEALDRRRPGSSPSVSPRKEADRLQVHSGLMALSPDETEEMQRRLLPLTDSTDIAVTLGSPIGFMVENIDHRQEAYDHLRDKFRPNHADRAYFLKYSLRDWRGGGRSSGRETISRVVAGDFARQLLCGLITARSADKSDVLLPEVVTTVESIGGCNDPVRFTEIIDRAKAEKDSLGGVVRCRVTNVPPGLGEPVFGKLQQSLASAMLSIGAVHGFEYGDGFKLGEMRGTEALDFPLAEGGTLTNHCGGILGGISTGEDIVFRVAFKPTPSIPRELPTINDCGELTTVFTAGRHDPCIALRGAEVVKAMTWMVLLDAWLINRGING